MGKRVHRCPLPGERVDRDGVFISRRGPGEGLLPRPEEDGRQRAVAGAERLRNSVILSEAKNPSSCSFDELQRSFVAFGSSG